MLRARSFRQAVTGTLFAVLASISTSPADSAPLFGLCLSEANVQGEAASHGHLSGVFNNRTLHHHPEMIVGPATWLELRPCSGMYMP